MLNSPSGLILLILLALAWAFLMVFALKLAVLHHVRHRVLPGGFEVKPNDVVPNRNDDPEQGA